MLLGCEKVVASKEAKLDEGRKQTSKERQAKLAARGRWSGRDRSKTQAIPSTAKQHVIFGAGLGLNHYLGCILASQRSLLVIGFCWQRPAGFDS